jgi:hypothetical protein
VVKWRARCVVWWDQQAVEEEGDLAVQGDPYGKVQQHGHGQDQRHNKWHAKGPVSGVDVEAHKGTLFELIERAKDIKKREKGKKRLLKNELFPGEAIARNQAAVDNDEDEDECDAATTEYHLMVESTVRSKQDTRKRKRGDEEDNGFDEVLEHDLGKKRTRTKEEEATAQAMAKTLLSALPAYSNGDDRHEAGIDTWKSMCLVGEGQRYWSVKLSAQMRPAIVIDKQFVIPYQSIGILWFIKYLLLSLHLATYVAKRVRVTCKDKELEAVVNACIKCSQYHGFI